uniref:DUF3504 domain-containing protein n=1 Tax=Anopheles maculatus TaxID=74869 RepID=A0A182S8J9_9DIPT
TDEQSPDIADYLEEASVAAASLEQILSASGSQTPQTAFDTAERQDLSPTTTGRQTPETISDTDVAQSLDLSHSSSAISSSDTEDGDVPSFNLRHCVNAWKRWVKAENARANSNYGKPWPEDFLQLGPEVLSHGLCLFMQSARRLSGDEYEPKRIFSLVIDIQRCLLDAGRNEYFWSDKRYEEFGQCFIFVMKRSVPPVIIPASKERIVYDQPANVDEPTRCPVKLYDFYISKCPSRMQNANTPYYLQPERTFMPSSPIWFSREPIRREFFESIFSRLKMVLEIENELLLSDNE